MSDLDTARAGRELDADAPGWIHSHDGWYWRRCENGDVAIVRRIQEPDDTAKVHRITAAHRLPAGIWASIVSYVSARGETSETFREALAFHNAPPADPAAASYEAAVDTYKAARALELDDTLDERPGRSKP